MRQRFVAVLSLLAALATGAVLPHPSPRDGKPTAADVISVGVDGTDHGHKKPGVQPLGRYW